MEELKECPFCGKKNNLTVELIKNGQKVEREATFATVKCLNCNLSMYATSRAERFVPAEEPEHEGYYEKKSVVYAEDALVEMWNRRANE